MLQKLNQKYALIAGLLLASFLLTDCSSSDTPPPPHPAPAEETAPVENTQAEISSRRQSPDDDDIKFEHISLEEGLSQSSVIAILQDSKGFMWFGTEDGLNKYDGYNFTVYKPLPGDPASLTHNYILSIFEDNQGAKHATHYQRDESDPRSLSHNSIRAIYQDRRGTLWVGTDEGLNRFDPLTGRFTHYRYSLSANAVRSIYQDQMGALWGVRFTFTDNIISSII